MAAVRRIRVTTDDELIAFLGSLGIQVTKETKTRMAQVGMMIPTSWKWDDQPPAIAFDRTSGISRTTLTIEFTAVAEASKT